MGLLFFVVGPRMYLAMGDVKAPSASPKQARQLKQVLSSSPLSHFSLTHSPHSHSLSPLSPSPPSLIKVATLSTMCCVSFLLRGFIILSTQIERTELSVVIVWIVLAIFLELIPELTILFGKRERDERNRERRR
jgi:hypothetical protein